jgi:A/G-specific adenine glycosylase
MLQQTQVQTVIPYYLNFLKLFPTIRDLATAHSQHLLRAWAGLGYYSRARNLQKAAQQILRNHHGKFPETVQELLTLPGIGRYTAGAILSIAFNQSFPVVDGNVTRVLSRLFLLNGDTRSSGFQEVLWGLAGQLLAKERPGDFNQALMELGSTLCSSRSPHCLPCPWNGQCLARQKGLEGRLPQKVKRAETVETSQAVAVIRYRGRFLITKRIGESILNDFWEFPGGEFNQAKALKRALATRIQRDFGLRIHVKELLMTVKHGITKHHITLQVFLAELKSPGLSPRINRNARWVRLWEANRYPLGAASMKILKALRERSPWETPQRCREQNGDYDPG